MMTALISMYSALLDWSSMLDSLCRQALTLAKWQRGSSVLDYPGATSVLSLLSSVTDLYKPGRTLGEGNYAKVQDCTQKDTNKRFLLKVISKAKIFGFEDVILRELNIMRLLNHPNIVKMEADFEDEDNHYLIMEHINVSHIPSSLPPCMLSTSNNEADITHTHTHTHARTHTHTHIHTCTHTHEHTHTHTRFVHT